MQGGRQDVGGGGHDKGVFAGEEVCEKKSPHQEHSGLEHLHHDSADDEQSSSIDKLVAGSGEEGEGLDDGVVGGPGGGGESDEVEGR